MKISDVSIFLLAFIDISTAAILNAPSGSTRSSPQSNSSGWSASWTPANVNQPISTQGSMSPDSGRVVISPKAAGPQLNATLVLGCLLEVLSRLTLFSPTAVAPQIALNNGGIYVFVGPTSGSHAATVEDLRIAMVQVGAWMTSTLWYGACEIAIYDASRVYQIGYTRVERMPFMSNNQSPIDFWPQHLM